MAYRHYERNVASLTPEEVLTERPDHVVRMTGLVRGGTLRGNPAVGRARFELAGQRETLSVRYAGPSQENLRELKTLVVVGRWDPAARIFRAHDIATVSNYGFVLGAYLVGLVPLACFLFAMERKVGLLYKEIKESKLYEPDWPNDVVTR
jgi:hypothetical protein